MSKTHTPQGDFDCRFLEATDREQLNETRLENEKVEGELRFESQYPDFDQDLARIEAEEARDTDQSLKDEAAEPK